MHGNGCRQKPGGGCRVEFGGRKVREFCQTFAFRPDGVAGVIERALPVEAAPAGRPPGQQLQFPVPAVDAECAAGVRFDDLFDAPVRIESTPRVVAQGSSQDASSRRECNCAINCSAESCNSGSRTS